MQYIVSLSLLFCIVFVCYYIFGVIAKKLKETFHNKNKITVENCVCEKCSRHEN